MREAGGVVPHAPVWLIKAETAPARRLGVRVPEPSPCAPNPSAEPTLSGKIRAGPAHFVIPATLAG